MKSLSDSAQEIHTHTNTQTPHIYDPITKKRKEIEGERINNDIHAYSYALFKALAQVRVRG